MKIEYTVMHMIAQLVKNIPPCLLGLFTVNLNGYIPFFNSGRIIRG